MDSVARDNTGRFGKGNPGKPKGAVNKTTKTLKEMILGALDAKGGQAWLSKQMDENPAAFMTMLGKVLPMTIQGGDGTKDGDPIVIHLHAGPRDKV